MGFGSEVTSFERPLGPLAALVTHVRNVDQIGSSDDRRCSDEPHVQLANRTGRRRQDKVRTQPRRGRHMILHEGRSFLRQRPGTSESALLPRRRRGCRGSSLLNRPIDVDRHPFSLSASVA